jgi:tetratricopeptide (TPR) repeat protein
VPPSRKSNVPAALPSAATALFIRGILALQCSLLALAFSTLVWAQAAPRTGASTQMQQLQRALSLAQHGDRQQAMSIAQELLRQDPKFVPAVKLKGMLLEESGSVTEAGAVYEEGLRLAPNDSDFLLKVAIYKLASGRKEDAVKLLRRCVATAPNDGDANFYLAQAYHLNGQDELALPAIRRSLKAEPDNVSVWQKYGDLLCSSGDCEAGLHWLQKAQLADATLPRIDFDIAAADYKLMDFDATARSATHAVEVQPNDWSAWQLLATVNTKLARWPDAKAAFEHVLALKPDDTDSVLGLGQCELELKNYQASVDRLQSVLRVEPTRLLAHFYLSRAYAAMGRSDDAQHEAALHQLMMEHVTFARSAESEQREAPIKAETQKLLAAHREDEAVRLYEAHFKGTAATEADAYVFLGKLYLFAGQTDDGLRCLHHALKLEPTVRGAHTYEGILALKLGDLARAEKEFTAELVNDPSYQLAIAEMGEVRYHQRRWADAADQLAKSKTMTPELLYLLCDSYFRINKVNEADLNAECLAAYGRNKPELMRALADLLVRNGQSDLAKRLSANLAP